MNEKVIQDIESSIRHKLFLSLEEIAEFLGVPEKTVYNWTRRVQAKRRLTKVVVGRHVRVARAELISWLSREFEGRSN